MVRLAGLAVSVQHPMTAKNFVFIALEDETGMINVTVRPDIYQANRAVLQRPDRPDGPGQLRPARGGRARSLRRNAPAPPL